MRGSVGESPWVRPTRTDAAWLSSARAVRCWVKSRNERNPYPMLPTVRPGTLRELPAKSWRKGGMTSSPYAPYVQGYTHATMVGTEGCQPARGSQSHKPGLSSDRGLQPAPVKVELLVTVGQPYRGECVPGPCTHRPSRHGSWQHLKPVPEPARGGAVEGGAGDWDEVVTR